MWDELSAVWTGSNGQQARITADSIRDLGQRAINKLLTRQPSQLFKE